MIAKGDIYESKKYHNAVFIGRDKDQNPRYATMRGTDEKRYRGEARGSEKAYGFGYMGTDEKLFVFESPIDLLSYITAVPEEWEKHSYISLRLVNNSRISFCAFSNFVSFFVPAFPISRSSMDISYSPKENATGFSFLARESFC